MIRTLQDVATAFQFLTRLPLGRLAYDPDALSRSAKFFPLVGLVIGTLGAALYQWLAPHWPAMVVALLVVIFFVLVTGGLHEDGLADAADAFGGGWNREQILTILKDGRIGSFGTLAIVFSVASRLLLLPNLPIGHFTAYVISAQVLCRWTALPLGYVLPGARESSGQGARIARQITGVSLTVGTLMAAAIVGCTLRGAMLGPMLSVLIVTAASGLYYWRRIGGITGDCFGATNQLAEIMVYLCGAFHR
jgi:adenosylcobinamide-GDP ribazoletransferase